MVALRGVHGGTVRQLHAALQLSEDEGHRGGPETAQESPPVPGTVTAWIQLAPVAVCRHLKKRCNVGIFNWELTWM